MAEEKVAVEYTGELSPDLDGEIKTMMKKSGWQFVGSGYSIFTSRRDLQFVREKKEEGGQ